VGVDTFIEKAGPTLATGIVLAILAGATSVTLAWRDYVAASREQLIQLRADHERLRAEFAEFRQPGDRFTASDGARHEQRIGKLEGQCSECITSRAEVMLRLQHMEREQEMLCKRVQGCGR
jgi:hypothetical protein